MEIKELVNAWTDFNNTLSEEEEFDENAFEPLFEETKRAAREICGKESFCRGDLRLVHELTRFVYKEIYSEEQDAAQEQVWVYLNALLAWGPLPV